MEVVILKTTTFMRFFGNIEYRKILREFNIYIF